MRILQIAPQVPFPLIDGGKVSIFNITKYLSLRGHQITFLALTGDRCVPDNPMPEFCELITVPHSNKNSAIGAAKNLLSSVPYNVSKYRSNLYQDILRRILQTKRFDVVHVDYLHMAPYGIICREQERLPIVLREHDVSSTILERYAETVPFGFRRYYLNKQVRRIQKYEGTMASMYDLCCAMTEDDRKRLTRLNPSTRVKVIPAGVDASFFSGIDYSGKVPDSISFFGRLDWIPNHDAVRWFLDSIFPLVRQQRPDARLFVIGEDSSSGLAKEGRDHVEFRGYVPDIKREVQKYTITIAPFRIGGGMRFKILESFAMRVPVVSTPVGCEGIGAIDGEHLLIGRSKEEFASQIVRLIDDEPLRNMLVDNAHRLARSKYRWESVAEMFEKCYAELVEDRNSFDRGLGARAS